MRLIGLTMFAAIMLAAGGTAYTVAHPGAMASSHLGYAVSQR